MIMQKHSLGRRKTIEINQFGGTWQYSQQFIEMLWSTELDEREREKEY